MDAVVEFCKDLHDGGTQIGCVAEVVVGKAGTFDKLPNVFDVVEFGAVRWKPDHFEG